MNIVFAFLSGLLFGAGLLVSGMANPAKVLGFLDLAGRWDPSLAFVMAGAIGVGSVAFAVVRRRPHSALGQPLRMPARAPVTRRLVLGSAAFGVGWGGAGFCPGPAIVALGTGAGKAFGFVAAMLVGMAVFEALERRRAARETRCAAPSGASAPA